MERKDADPRRSSKAWCLWLRKSLRSLAWRTTIALWTEEGESLDLENQHLPGERHGDVPVVTRPWKVNRPWARLEEQSTANGVVMEVDLGEKWLEAAPNQQASREIPSPNSIEDSEPYQDAELMDIGSGTHHLAEKSQGDAPVPARPCKVNGHWACLEERSTENGAVMEENPEEKSLGVAPVKQAVRRVARGSQKAIQEMKSPVATRPRKVNGQWAYSKEQSTTIGAVMKEILEDQMLEGPPDKPALQQVPGGNSMEPWEVTSKTLSLGQE